MDTDDSEDIDPAELRKEFTRLGLCEGDASNVMSYYDTDGNGKLDLNEFVWALLDIFDHSLAGFKAEQVLVLGFSLQDRDSGGGTIDDGTATRVSSTDTSDSVPMLSLPHERSGDSLSSSISRTTSSESQKARARRGESSRRVSRERDQQKGGRDQSELDSENFLRQLQALLKPTPLPRAESLQGRRPRSGTRSKDSQVRAVKILKSPIQSSQ
jgi:hypothetical protein